MPEPRPAGTEDGTGLRPATDQDGAGIAPAPRRPRPYALAAFFGLVGFLPANWLVRVPDVKDHVGASASVLGLALLSGSIGGLVATLAAGRICVWFGTRRVMVTGACVLSVVLVLPALAGSPRWLGAALVALAVSQSTYTIALNSTAVEAAAATGNPLMPTLHGVFSVGGMVGAAVGGVAADWLTPPVHLALVGVLGLVTIGWFGPRLRRTDRPSSRPAAPTPAAPTPADAPGRAPGTPEREWRAVRWIVLLFAVIAGCTAFAEFTNNNWAALHLREDLGASPAVAAYGYGCYAAAIAAGRFAGSRLIRRLGETTVLCGGFLLAAVGILGTSWADELGGGLPLAFVAYVLLGLGLANVYPLAISRGGLLGGPRGVSRISMVASFGVLSQAPLIGFLADRHGLPAALSTVTTLALLGGGLALALRRWSPPLRARAERPAANPAI